jgi:hypothetical protein
MAPLALNEGKITYCSLLLASSCFKSIQPVCFIEILFLHRIIHYTFKVHSYFGPEKKYAKQQ